VVLGTTFDDEAPIAIGAVTRLHLFLPAGDHLYDFDGIDPNGIWELVLTDHTGERRCGRIEDWSLTFSFEPEDADALTVVMGGDISETASTISSSA
jgi:subtilisin-like proprotein convertase family protein